jgi:hypothetical protein
MPNVRAGKCGPVGHIAGGKCIVPGMTKHAVAVSFVSAVSGARRAVPITMPGKYGGLLITVASRAYHSSSDIKFQGAEYVRI